MENNVFNLALSLIKGIGSSKYIKLIEKFSEKLKNIVNEKFKKDDIQLF